MSNTTAAEKAVRGNRKERIGVVVSDCQNKTIVVQVVRTTAHKLYKKVIKVNKKYVAHDENNEAVKGDKVKITETRPLSKNKRWILREVIARAE
jgi:small subunit ribosomal protein S17